MLGCELGKLIMDGAMDGCPLEIELGVAYDVLVDGFELGPELGPSLGTNIVYQHLQPINVGRWVYPVVTVGLLLLLGTVLGFSEGENVGTAEGGLLDFQME